MPVESWRARATQVKRFSEAKAQASIGRFCSLGFHGMGFIHSVWVWTACRVDLRPGGLGVGRRRVLTLGGPSWVAPVATKPRQRPHPACRVAAYLPVPFVLLLKVFMRHPTPTSCYFVLPGTLRPSVQGFHALPNAYFVLSVQWLAATAFVAAYSTVIAVAVPFFCTLGGCNCHHCCVLPLCLPSLVGCTCYMLSARSILQHPGWVRRGVGLRPYGMRSCRADCRTVVGVARTR